MGSGSLAAWGALQGLGGGIANAGSQILIDERQREREDAILQRERERQASLDARNQDTLALRREVAEIRAGAAGGGRGGVDPARTMQQMLIDPAGLNDWVVELDVDLASSRASGDPVIQLTRLGGLIET